MEMTYYPVPLWYSWRWRRELSVDPIRKQMVFCQFSVRFLENQNFCFMFLQGRFFPAQRWILQFFQIIIDEKLETKLPSDRWEPFFGICNKGIYIQAKTTDKCFFKGDRRKRDRCFSS